uniref:Fibroin heavy chain-like n=1 Tax=Dendroctonus ponderosae TaxID=77166 RepID=A0AAR5PR44_DENPD
MKHPVSLLVVLVVVVHSCQAHVVPQPLTASFSGSSSSASAFSQASSSSYKFDGNVDPQQIEQLKHALTAGAAAHASAGASAGSAAQAGAVAEAKAGAAAGAGSLSGATAAAGAAAAGSLGTEHETNSISEPAVPVDAGSYKSIGSDKYSTGYSSGAKTNYAVSNNYVHGSQNSVGGCATCKGPFPGPNGSIHDYKLASSVPALAGAQSGQQASAGAAAVSHQTSTTFPGDSGHIYTSKPVTEHQGAGAGSSEYSGSGHVSSGLISSFPGPTGSIYDSKPVGAAAAASSGAASGASYGAGSGATSGSSTSSGFSSHTLPAPPCSYSSGSSNCGVAPHSNPQPNAGSGLSGIIGVLPGPSGSIHDSKPAVAGAHGAAAIAGSGAYSGSGSLTGGHSAAAAGAVADSGVVGGSYDGTGSITNNPTTHSASRPVSQVSSGAVSQASASASAQGTSEVNGPFPGPSGSIHDYKPAPVVGSGYSGSGAQPACSYTPGSPNPCSTGGSSYGSSGNVVKQPVLSAAGSGSSTGSYDAGSSSSSDYSGSVSNIPASHPVVGPACSYTPGSPSKCSGKESSVSAPSIHPELPSSGTYYVNKPSVDVEPPLVVAAPNFSSQYPCVDSSCGTVQNGAESDAHAGSGGSGVIYVDHNQEGQYQGVNHDSAHLSGGLVFQNEDGTYSNAPIAGNPIYKNAQKGGYAVSSNEADNTGILIGPGTGQLPVEADAKPFGTQGAFGGSAAFAKDASGSQGLSGGVSGGFTNKAQAISGSGASSGHNYGAANQQHSTSSSGALEFGSEITPVKEQCSSCGDTEVIAAEPIPSSSHAGAGASGFATGHVLLNQGSNTYDVTNAGAYSGSSQFGLPGCGSGKCSFGGGSYGGAQAGGILEKLFGGGGLSGAGFKQFGSQAGSAAYSSSGSYSGASAGSFASAQAGASARAQAGSYAHSY